MDYGVLMELVSELGVRLISAGAEIYRSEESIARVAKAYGLTAKVYAIPNSIVITLLVPDGLPVTRLCRIENRGTDLDAVEHYSNLCRQICAEKPDLQEALQMLDKTESVRKHYSLPVFLLGNILVGCGFCAFFGGSLRDSLCAGGCSLLVGILSCLLAKNKVNTFFEKILASFIMAVAACGMAALGWTDSVDTVMIGTLMLLVPGVLFTNAMRDIIFGDTNSGINRIVETLLIAVAIASGTAVAWRLSDIIWDLPVQAAPLQYAPLSTCLMALVACTGFAIVFNIHGAHWLCALGGCLAWGAYCLVQHFDGNLALCSLAATVVSAVYAEIMARVRKYPAISYLVISLVPMIPGAGIYYCAQHAIAGSYTLALEQGVRTLTIAGMIAVGILMVSTVARSINAYKAARKAARKSKV